MLSVLQAPSRKNLYQAILSKLRGLMIARMAKPEEVIVVEDENGNIVRETMKDTDTLARYKTMHETLVYLSNLGHEDTETQMLEQLRLQASRVAAWHCNMQQYIDQHCTQSGGIVAQHMPSV